MPANGSLDIDKKEYVHVFNKGIDKTVLFKDIQDYDTFLSYLNEYLSSPIASENVKTTFTVRGKSFKGTPHQPKNYFNKVELLAYELKPQQYNLLLKPKDSDLLERFIRSLCTRYSIYYNKKYARTGSLFAGPYKSTSLKNIDEALLLSSVFHKNSNPRSTFAEYTGRKKTSWVKTDDILSSHGSMYYQKFLSKHELTTGEKSILKRIMPDNHPLVRSDLESTLIPATSPIVKNETPKKVKQSRAPELFGAALVFLVLIAFGIKNIHSLNAAPVPKVESLTEQTVLSEYTFNENEASSSASPAIDVATVTVNITDGAKSVNIRSKPTISSEKIGDALQGDSFGLISFKKGWYEVNINATTSGFISARYIQKQNE